MESTTSVNFMDMLAHDDEWLVANVSNIIQQIGGVRKLLEIVADHTNNHDSHSGDATVITASSPLVPTVPSTTQPLKSMATISTNSNLNTSTTSNASIHQYQPVTAHTTIAGTVAATTSQCNTNNRNNHVIASSSQLITACNNCKHSTITVYPLNDGIHWIVDFLCNRDCIRSNPKTIDTLRNMSDKISKLILSIPFCGLYGLTPIFTILTWYLQHEKIFVIAGFEIWLVFETCWLIQTILLLLCFDRQLFYQQLQSFDVWYRMYNILLYCVCDIYLDPSVAANFLSFVVGIPAILFMTCVDALPVTRKTRLIVFLADTTLGCLFYVVFYFGIRDDVEIFIFDRKISLKTLALGAMANIAIFTMKQLYHFIKDPTKATNVSNRPKLIVFSGNP